MEGIKEPEYLRSAEMKESRSLPAEQQAEIVFNAILEKLKAKGEMDGDEFIREVNLIGDSMAEISPSFDDQGGERIRQILNEIKPSISGSKLKFMDGLKGAWDGKEIYLSPNLVLDVVRGKDSSFLRAIRAHEDYHKDNKHEQGFKTGATAEGAVKVTIGGEDFTKEELVEAINLIDVPVPSSSGHPYQQYAEKLIDAVRHSRTVESISEVRKAINKTKDLSSVEDQAA